MNSIKGTAFDTANYVPRLNYEGYGTKRSTQSGTPGDPMSSDDPKVRMACSSRVSLPINQTPKRIEKARI